MHRRRTDDDPCDADLRPVVTGPALPPDPGPEGWDTVVVVGNPKPRSRTLDAATLLVQAFTGQPPDAVVDLVEMGPKLLSWDDPDVATAVERVAAADLLVVASPTYKASYTGLLKLFLERFPTADGLQGVVALPLMLGAAPLHAMAPEVMLKPVLVEVGATCPAPGLFLIDHDYAHDPRLDAYVARWAPTVQALAGSPRT